MTPYNPETPRYAALALTLDVSPEGRTLGAALSTPLHNIDVTSDSVEVTPGVDYCAFNVFYYLFSPSSTPAEREILELKPVSHYAITPKSANLWSSAAVDDALAADDFRQALKEIGIKGSTQRKLIATLAGLLTLGNTIGKTSKPDDVAEACEEASMLFGLSPNELTSLSGSQRRGFMSKFYKAIVNWVILKANETIASEVQSDEADHLTHRASHVCQPTDASNTDDSVQITVVDIPDPSFGKAVAMQTNFDKSFGINAEAIEDGVASCSDDSGLWEDTCQAMLNNTWYQNIMVNQPSANEVSEWDEAQHTSAKIANLAEEDSLLKLILSSGISKETGSHAFNLYHVLNSSRIWYHLSIYPGLDTASNSLSSTLPIAPWSLSDVSKQIESWRLQDWATQTVMDPAFTVDFGIHEFSERYSVILEQTGMKGDISAWLRNMACHTDLVVGKQRIWISEELWWRLEGRLDMQTALMRQQRSQNLLEHKRSIVFTPGAESYFSSFDFNQSPERSADDLLLGAYSNHESTDKVHLGTNNPFMRHSTASLPKSLGPLEQEDPELAKPRHIETKRVDLSRRLWVVFVRLLTFWIPSALLTQLGRMRRPDVRQAWREKLVIFAIILFINALILFWMIGLGPLLCPKSDKVWNRKQVATHQGDNDFWVSIHGKVYDISDFWKRQHSDTDIKTTTANMQPLAGFDLDNYFVPPLYLACEALGIAETTRLVANTTPEYTIAVHTSGYYAVDKTSALSKPNWYWTHFKTSIKEYYKGDLVYSESRVKKEAEQGRMWARYGNQIYDLTDYFHTQDLHKDDKNYEFLSGEITKLWEDNPGKNIKEDLDAMIEDSTNKKKHEDIVASWRCIQNIGYKGILDFRDSAKCQVNNWLLLAFTVIVCAIILVKFLAALRFGSKRRPSQQDKFVICQIPAYTEDEESLARAMNSLTALKYDNKRKLLCVVCDGIAVGEGNDRPTSKIILDILSSDISHDPPALPFKSIGSGSEQLNYGKVYSGLYEWEGSIVPYIVIVKVGKESEQNRPKPGNRGKRDSQMLLLSFLNRVFHNSPMNPLELEIFHHINNIIGVDPRLYEFLLMVDADTAVHEDALNHLVAACAHNTKIAGICGETRLGNDGRSWWTMIQVYEYFISHHLAKAFESLFGSVTCLPGCFTMYRLRTYDGKKPLIISDAVIKDYSVCDVETLHLKNLLSLGEDRYLTTLMIKHFPRMWLKFLPEAQCQTVAPESWKVLLSQRRRWINSTIHNLVELMRLENMCGECCFNMRVVVFADLFGTIIFPATCVYLAYLVYEVATGKGQFPMISIILLAATYGLQALLFLLKREWQHIGWMIIYLMALPVYSIFLPMYSFWNQDNFSWGNTRVVVGEKGDKQLVAIDDDEGFDPTSIPLRRGIDYASMNNLPNRQYQALRGSVHSTNFGTRSRETLCLSSPSKVMLDKQSTLGAGHVRLPREWNRRSTTTASGEVQVNHHDKPKS
ncbi:hypothetical protein IL306_011654, partial [Fusarium sp. DS 682]